MTEKPIFPILDHLDDFRDQRGPGMPRTAADSNYKGIYVLAGSTAAIGYETASPQVVELNFTAPPGKASAVYYSFVFHIPKFDYNLVKVDEWIEVSPTRADYYQATVASKEALAGTIKQGLASAAAAISDFELAKHDVRKYKEILNYFNDVEKAKKIKDEKARPQAIRKAEHSLRAMFVDQVDLHTGEGVSLRSIAPRWSTIISDFMRLTDEMDDVEKIRKELSVSRAEAVILKTKNQVYFEWKKLFSEAAIDRYKTLLSLLESRKKSIDEYKDWIKPYLVRFKIMKVGAERKDVQRNMLKSFADVTGQSTFSNAINLWLWKPHKLVEERKNIVEKTGKTSDFIFDPYDDFVRENFVLSKKTGLAHPNFYPWLANILPKDKAEKLEIVKSGRIKAGEATVADEIAEEIKSSWKKQEMRLNPNELYYTFFTIDIMRLGTRTQVGELEDITFTIRNFVMSQNVLLVKLIELRAREMDLEKYIEQMMGVHTTEGAEISEVMKESHPELFGAPPKEEPSSLEKIGKEISEEVGRYSDYFKSITKSLQTPNWVRKPGHYEADWKDRMTELILKGNTKNFGQLVGFLKGKFGIE